MPLRLRRGTDSTRTSITPVQGEPIYTTDTKKLFIGDGTTAGGVEVGGTPISSSYATTASYVLNSVSSSFATTSATASYVLNAVSSSFSTNSMTASYYGGTVTSASFATNSMTASYYGGTVTSASFATTSATASYVLNSVSASFATTATTASYVLQAVSSSFATNSMTASYYGGTVTSASFAQTASFVNPLRQTVQITGSLTTTGSNTLIGSTSLTGSFSVSGSQALNGFIGFEPVSALNIPTNKSASYIYTSGSTNDMWFTQYQGPYTNSTRLRWLEAGIATGLLYGGVLSTITGSTLFSVTGGEGIIVTQNAFTGSSPYPTIQLVSWPSQSLSITNSGSSKITYVGVNGSGNIVQQTVAWGSTDITQFDTEIELGAILHLSGSVSSGVLNTPQITYAHPQQADDFIRAFGPLKISGHTLQPSGSTLGIIKSGGFSYLQGSNYRFNPNHPSTIEEPAETNGRLYRYYISGSTPVIDTGINNLGYIVIDPTKRVNTSTGGLVTVPPAKYSLQRVFWIPGNTAKAFIVYYGNAQYDSLIDALNAKDTEPFSEAPDTANGAILLGWIAVAGGASNLSSPTDATIAPAGIFRSVGGIGSTGTTPVSTTLAGLSDVSIGSKTDGDLLYYNGSQWVNSKSLTGNYSISGSLTVGNTTIANGSITGSLFGSSSYATVALSSSFATNSYTASYVLNAVSSSFSTNSMTASYYGGTVTSASFATTSATASYVLNSVSASFATTATTASYVLQAVSSSFSTNSMTASYFSGTVTSASFASTASFLSGGVTSASFASTASYWSGTVTSASYAQTATTASYSYQQFSNVETLSGTKTILSTDPSVQILNPNGATRTVVLPTDVPTGSKFEIWNSGTDVASNTLNVGDGVYYGFQVDPSQKITVRYTGQNIFTGPGYPWTIDGETAVSVASNYNNYSYGIGIGYAANNNYDYGIGIGRTAQNNYTNGVGIGYEAQNNYSYGVGTGYSAYNNYTYGIGIGWYAYNNNSNGIGIGKGAYSNYSSGIGIGENASSNYTYGVGIGQNAQNNYNYGVSIGAVATSNAKGTGTVAIGAYSKAERQNEFVTTGTGISTNQAQSIIQKFRNKSLATAAGAFQEIFTDAGSGRLTILASSIYHFRIQINAIEATGFKCKTWEITGAVKRDASNNTTMVGGAPTYYITSEDSGTGNWDVKASANDTNEALKIEVKHDSANNVTFSATVWATETRL